MPKKKPIELPTAPVSNAKPIVQSVQMVNIQISRDEAMRIVGDFIINLRDPNFVPALSLPMERVRIIQPAPQEKK